MGLCVLLQSMLVYGEVSSETGPQEDRRLSRRASSQTNRASSLADGGTHYGNRVGNNTGCAGYSRRKRTRERMEDRQRGIEIAK